MFRLATSPIAPLIGQRLPRRGSARLLNRSYLRAYRSTGRPERVLRTKAGDLFQADLDSFQEWELWVYGAIGDHVARLFSYLVRPGDRCVDVGIGIGLHTVRLARLTGMTGEVIGIEPDAEIARRAAANVALNGLANVQIIQATAPTLATDTVKVYRPADLNPNRGMANPRPCRYPPGAGTEVTTITIDEACPGPVALINIDAAGHEASVVAGAAATIKRYFPAIVFECSPDLRGDSAQAAFGQLADAGYLLYRITSRRRRLTGRGQLHLVPLYAQPEPGGHLLAISERTAPQIIPLVAARDGRV